MQIYEITMYDEVIDYVKSAAELAFLLDDWYGTQKWRIKNDISADSTINWTIEKR